MSYTPSFMHIISAERRIANECTPDPIQFVSHESSYKERERSSYSIPLKTPIIKVDVKTAETVEVINYTKQLPAEDIARIANRSLGGGFISGGFYWVRSGTWEYMALNSKREAIALCTKGIERSKGKRVTAHNMKTGETIETPTQTEMAEHFNMYPSTLAHFILKGKPYLDWEVYYTDFPRVIYKAPVKRSSLNVNYQTRIVRMINNKTGEEHTFDSVTAASNFLNCHSGSISVACRLGQNCHGYSMCYIGKDGEPERELRTRAKPKRKPTNRRRVALSKAGFYQEFDSIGDCATFLGKIPATVFSALSRGHKTGEYLVKYLDSEVKQD